MHRRKESPPPWLWDIADRSVTRIASYAARNEWRQLLKEISNQRRLEHFGRKVYSQNDEDGIIQEIFRRLEITPRSGRFVEFGVEHGLECNTHFLLHCGFSGLWLDSSEANVRMIQQTFKLLIARKQLGIVQAFVTTDNIDRLLSDHLAKDEHVALVSIDIDGNDFWIWEAIESIVPAVVVIEYNAKFPPPLSIVQEYRADYVWRGTDYFGASLGALDRLAKIKGYQLVACNITGGNAFFIRDDLVGDRFPYDLSVNNLYQPCRYHLTDDCFRRVGHPPDFGPYVHIGSSD